jgi:hypothetical protein
LVVLFGSTACSAMRRGNVSDDETDVVTVVVVNHHQLNVTVYNIVQGRRDRLGEVTSAASSSFKLHLRRLTANDIQLLADPIGSTRAVTSEVVHVAAGDEVRWILETDLGRSHIEIR